MFWINYGKLQRNENAPGLCHSRSQIPTTYDDCSEINDCHCMHCLWIYFWCCFQHFFLCQPSYDSIETVIIDFLIVRSHYYSTERCFWWRCNYQVSNYCLYNSFYSIVSHNSLLGRYYIAFTTNLIFIWISHSTFSSSHFFPILL